MYLYISLGSGPSKSRYLDRPRCPQQLAMSGAHWLLVVHHHGRPLIACRSQRPINLYWVLDKISAIVWTQDSLIHCYHMASLIHIEITYLEVFLIQWDIIIIAIGSLPHIVPYFQFRSQWNTLWIGFSCGIFLCGMCTHTFVISCCVTISYIWIKLWP